MHVIGRTFQKGSRPVIFQTTVIRTRLAAPDGLRSLAAPGTTTLPQRSFRSHLSSILPAKHASRHLYD